MTEHIEERFRVEEARLREMDMWELLFTIAPCGLLLIDQQAAIKAINPLAAKLLGVENLEAVIGRPLTEQAPKWKDTPFSASLPSLMGAQSTFESVEFDVPGMDGSQLRVCAVHVPNGKGQARGVLLSVTECTEVAHLERRLHRAEYQASIGKLARGIAHELNSPLDGVMRYTHIALEQLEDGSPVREYLVHVKEGLERMVRAVKSFLEFSRQVTTPTNRKADINKLIEDVLVLFRHRVKFQQVGVVKAFEEHLPAVNDAGLQHAIANLIKNAFDVMPKGGKLSITTRRVKDRIIIQIEDTGPGIPEEIRSRVFEPFYSTKPIHQGNGLGLIIAKEAIERSGGTIDFTSEVGIGTRFRIGLPISGTEERENG